MNGDFYIGNGRKRPRSKKDRRRRRRRLCALFVCFLVALALFAHFSLLPQVKALCESSLSNRLETLASSKAYTVLSEGEYRYTDFIKLSYATDGAVQSASVDTVGLNLLKTRVALLVLEALSTEDISVSVPTGNLLGFLFFSEVGGEVSVSARVAEGMRARFHTVFTEAGINQTRHAIGFSLDFTAHYLLPTGRETVAFSVEIPIGETLIVGKVPDSLTQISRLTDGVTEYDIDDAVDFGNVIN